MQLKQFSRFDERGQAGAITAQLTLIISLLVAVIVVYQLFIARVGPTTERFIVGHRDYATVNPAFTDNAARWDNRVEDNAVNAWNPLGFVTVTTTDNDAITDNGIWSQGITVAAFDNVVSARTTFRFRVIDNLGRSSIVVRALLNATELFRATLVENTAVWTTVDNNVAPFITVGGTYTLHLRAELLGAGPSVNLQVGFDDARLAVRTSARNVPNPDFCADALEAYNNVVTLSWAGIGLMAVAIIILAASVIIGVVRGFGGAGL
jgi:hypothetical protein